MSRNIRQFVHEFPVMVWMIAGVFLLDIYLLALSGITRRQRDYRLTPDVELQVASVKKPSPFGEARKRRSVQALPPVAERPGEAVLPSDQQRLLDATYTPPLLNN